MLVGIVLQRIIIYITVVILALQTVPRLVFAENVTDRMTYCQQNDVLYYNCTNCHQTSPPPSNSPGSGNQGDSPSGEGGGCGDKSGNSKANIDQAWNFLVNKFMSVGFTQDEAQKAAAGPMGNWQQESGYDPTSHSNNCNGPCFGIAQWDSSRTKAENDFAQERGKPADCLGVELEYAWHEMTVKFGPQDLIGQMKGKSPSEASALFDKIFEGSDGSGDREGKAEQKYKELTGNSVSPLSASSSTPSGSTSPACPTGANPTGQVPSPDCQSAAAAIKQLHSSGKIKYDKEDLIARDVDRCTTDPIECGTGGGPGGANPNTLRGLAAIEMNSGVQSMTLWNINSGHPCDGLDHPHGLASDIKQANGSECTGSADVCKPIFDYIIAHMKDLSIKYVIWYGPYCTQKQSGSGGSVMCMADHNDHIHVSFNPTGGSGKK